MRIAIWHNLPSGGGKRALYDHVRGLIARGHYVESWCPPTADQEFLPIGDLVPEHVVPFSADVQPYGRALARLRGGGSLIPATFRAMDNHSRRCAEEIGQRSFDVLLAGSSRLFAVTGLARYVTCPSLLYLQEPCRFLYEASPRLPWPAPARSETLQVSAVRNRLKDLVRVHGYRIQAREELAGVQAYDRVLANSYFSRESMLRAYGIDSRVCYLGIDTQRFRDYALERHQLVIGVGAFVPQKRIEVVIQAVANTRSPHPALAWIGNSADPRYLKDVVELAHRQKVDFTAYHDVPQERVVELLNSAAVMAYAPRLEPFGYAPLEAAACGLPVVAQAEGGVRETVIDGETGLLVTNERELSAAIQRILDDVDYARRLGTASRRQAEQMWSLAAGVDRLEAQLLNW